MTRLERTTTRAATLGLGALLSVTILSGPATADPAVVDRVVYDDADAPLIAAMYAEECGFPVAVTIDGHRTPVHRGGVLQESIHLRYTLTANGTSLTYLTYAHWTAIGDTFRVTGIGDRLYSADGRELAKSRGNAMFVFTEQEVLEILRGKHEDSLEICSYLSV